MSVNKEVIAEIQCYILCNIPLLKSRRDSNQDCIQPFYNLYYYLTNELFQSRMKLYLTLNVSFYVTVDDLYIYK